MTERQKNGLARLEVLLRGEIASFTSSLDRDGHRRTRVVLDAGGDISLDALGALQEGYITAELRVDMTRWQAMLGDGPPDAKGDDAP